MHYRPMRAVLGRYRRAPVWPFSSGCSFRGYRRHDLFRPSLTGRENVYLNCAILGMRSVETKQKFDRIVAVPGTDKFIDTPVKFYSTGMQKRLAFAVATHLEPEIRHHRRGSGSRRRQLSERMPGKDAGCGQRGAYG